MAEYNLSEFRANVRKAFDEASRGEPVYIERYGEDFILISKENWQNTVNIQTSKVKEVVSKMPKASAAPAKKINLDPQADELPGVSEL